MCVSPDIALILALSQNLDEFTFKINYRTFQYVIEINETIVQGLFVSCFRNPVGHNNAYSGRLAWWHHTHHGCEWRHVVILLVSQLDPILLMFF